MEIKFDKIELFSNSIILRKNVPNTKIISKRNSILFEYYIYENGNKTELPIDILMFKTQRNLKQNLMIQTI
jgi:hypothetical protein